MAKELEVIEYENDGLTELQREFCVQYVACNNGLESARRAGYSNKNDKSLGVQASKLLALDKIQNKINQLRIDIKMDAINDTDIDKETVIKWIADIANPINEFKYNPTQRMKAMELLGKAIGLFVEKKEITQEINLNNPANLSDDELDKLLKQFDSNIIDMKYVEIE